MSAEKRDFNALEAQVVHLTNVVEKHAAVVRSIAAAAAKLRGGRTWFTASGKSIIDQELRKAEMNECASDV